MARISKITTLTQPIWPDKTIYTSVFADQPPTPDHATPQTADPAWNDLITDYISQTDSNPQTIASALGLGALGALTSDVFRISPITGWAPVTPANILEINPNSFTLPASPFVLRLMAISGTVLIPAGASNALIGLQFNPTINFTTLGGTMTSFTSILAAPTIGGSSPFTLANVTGFSSSIVLNSNGTYTTVKGVNITATPSGTTTTLIGLDLLVGSGGTVTNRIAMRDTSTNSTSRLNSLLRLGDQTAPIMQTEINGGLGVKVNTQTVNYTALLSDHYILGDATTAAITITLPTSAGSFNSGVGQRLSIKKKDSSVNTVTIAANGADTIQGVATVVLSAQYNSRTLYTDGSGQWFVESST